MSRQMPTVCTKCVTGVLERWEFKILTLLEACLRFLEGGSSSDASPAFEDDGSSAAVASSAVSLPNAPARRRFAGGRLKGPAAGTCESSPQLPHLMQRHCSPQGTPARRQSQYRLRHKLRLQVHEIVLSEVLCFDCALSTSSAPALLFEQPRHEQSDEQKDPLAKHTQYAFRQREFLQKHPLLRAVIAARSPRTMVAPGSAGSSPSSPESPDPPRALGGDACLSCTSRAAPTSGDASSGAGGVWAAAGDCCCCGSMASLRGRARHRRESVYARVLA